MAVTLNRKIDLILTEVGLEEDAFEFNSKIPLDDLDMARHEYFWQEENFFQQRLVMEHPDLFECYMWPGYESILPPSYSHDGELRLLNLSFQYRIQFAAMQLNEEKYFRMQNAIFINECKEKLLAMGYKEGDLVRLKEAAESNEEDIVSIQIEIDHLQESLDDEL